MSLLSQLAAVKTAIDAACDAAALVLQQKEQIDSNMDHIPNSITEAMDDLSDCMDDYNDAVAAVALPHVTVSATPYEISLPQVKWNGTVYTAEQIKADTVLAAAMIAAGVSFIYES